MKVKCLKCDKEFESPTGRAKFCSDSCRVMYHRKNNTAKVKEKLVHNQIMEALGEIRQVVKDLNAPTNQIRPITDTQPTSNTSYFVPSKTPQMVLKSFEYYRAAKKEIELEEDWVKMKAEILAAPNLTEKQKNLLITTNI